MALIRSTGESEHRPALKVGAAEIHFTFCGIRGPGRRTHRAASVGATARRRLVPNRLQSVAELSYELMADTLRNTAGEEGMKFFPLVLSLFMFILMSNVVGIIPYTFTVTSHIIITAALALTVFFTVIIYGIWKNGLHFFNLFLPSGIPGWMAPMIVIIELSFLSRRSRTACGCSPTCWPARSR